MYLSVSWCCSSERVAGRKSGVMVETLINLSLICLERPIHWSMMNSQPALQKRKIIILLSMQYQCYQSKYNVYALLQAHLECASIPDFPLCSVVEDVEPVLDFVVVPNPVPSSCMCERANELDTSGLRK